MGIKNAKSIFRVSVLNHSVVSNCLRPCGLWPSRLLYPWGFSRQDYWSGLPCPPPGELPDPGIDPRSHTLQMNSFRVSTSSFYLFSCSPLPTHISYASPQEDQELSWRAGAKEGFPMIISPAFTTSRTSPRSKDVIKGYFSKITVKCTK